MTTEFDHVFEAITNVVEFNPVWNNGTGYLNNAVVGKDRLAIEPGQLVKFVTENGRKAIAIGTRIGAVVAFQRYTGSSDVVVCNAHPDLDRVGLTDGLTQLSDGNILTIFGYVGEDNTSSMSIHTSVGHMFRIVNKYNSEHAA